MKGYQEGPTFNAQAYNQAPGAETPYGLQQLARPLTQAQIADLIAGRPIRQATVAPATRFEAYNPASMITPNATNVYQLPVIPTTTFSPGGVSPVKPNDPVRAQLAYDQQVALAQGNTDLYWQIQAKLDALDNPTTSNVVK
jgi:hypothetical protein